MHILILCTWYPESLASAHASTGEQLEADFSTHFLDLTHEQRGWRDITSMLQQCLSVVYNSISVIGAHLVSENEQGRPRLSPWDFCQGLDRSPLDSHFAQEGDTPSDCHSGV